MTAERSDRIGTRARMLLAGLVALNAACLDIGDGSDPMFAGDAFEFGRAVELLPGVPWIGTGRDRRYGTADDQAMLVLVGDVDLALRTGVTSIGAVLPATSPLRGGPPETVTEPLGAGVPIEFAVTPTSADGETPVDSPAFANVPVLAVAFADFDGDGFVGVTALDGDDADANLEEGELAVVGRRFTRAVGSRAAGQLFVSAGGPAGAELRLLVTAAAYTGPTDPNHFGGVVPTGPAVFAAFPFLPRSDPDRVLDGNLPGAADENELVGVEVEDLFTPDPSRRYGEAFTLPTDGSVASADIALARSGEAVRFSAVRPVDPQNVTAGVPLRPGLGAGGERVLFELPDAFALPGGGGELSLTIVPLDRLGNVADLAAPTALTVRATGAARIVAPDADGNATIETLVAGDARGVAVTLDGEGSGAGATGLVIEGGSGLSFVELLDGVAAQ